MVKGSNGLTIAWSIQTPVMLRDESNEAALSILLMALGP